MKLQEISLEQWQAFAESCPEALAFHHRSWQDLLIGHYGFRSRILALVERGEVTAAAPFLETLSITRRRDLVSLPYSDCVPPLAGGVEELNAFWEALAEEGFEGYRSVRLRTVGAEPPFPSSAHWVRHRVDLEDVEPRLPSSVRRNLKRAEDRGLAFSVRGDAEAMDGFFRLHVLTRRKLGVPVQPRSFFRRLQEQIVAPGFGFVAVVSKGSHVVSAAVFLSFGSTLIYKYGASHPDALGDRPNELLFSRALQVGREGGYRWFDFGVTRLANEGLRRFKRKWGAREDPVYHAFVRGMPGGPTGRGWPHRAAGAVIRRSPTVVCRAVGAALYRFAS